jgi:alkanesulfonate monooxygenase SsuD/methylene tetrahydromethanopterin reductase-like flavin-dependent oxidoreductase (luciferase family)
MDPTRTGGEGMRTSPMMTNGNAFKLGLFSANCSGGLSPTRVPEHWNASWENNLALARMADEAGLDFLVPVARWKGFGGETQYQLSSLETAAWATGLLAHTRSITVFGTSLVYLIHPLFAAKQFATADLIGGGRFAVNLVAGWKQDEFDMFGREMLPHDERYALAQEWWDLVTQIWERTAEFDFNGKYFHGKAIISEPKPVGGARPLTMNAAASTAGRAFAVRNCDLLFTPISDFDKVPKDMGAIETLAQQIGRKPQIMTSFSVFCRPSRKEAEDYFRYCAKEMEDTRAVDTLMAELGINSQVLPPENYALYRERFAAGYGNYPLIGTPDDVVKQLAQAHSLGFVGATLAFVNYLRELPFVISEVLPRLERLGLRKSRDRRVSTTA